METLEARIERLERQLAVARSRARWLVWARASHTLRVVADGKGARTDTDNTETRADGAAANAR
jgi:hypothetical protein